MSLLDSIQRAKEKERAKQQQRGVISASSRIRQSRELAPAFNKTQKAKARHEPFVDPFTQDVARTRKTMLDQGRDRAARNAAYLVGARTALDLTGIRPTIQAFREFANADFREKDAGLGGSPEKPNLFSDLFLTDKTGEFQGPVRLSQSISQPALRKSVLEDKSPFIGAAGLIGGPVLAALDVVPGVGGGKKVLTRAAKGIATTKSAKRIDSILRGLGKTDFQERFDLVKLFRNADDEKAIAKVLSGEAPVEPKLLSSIRKSDQFTKETGEKIGTTTRVVSNKETLRNARRLIKNDGGIDAAKDNLLAKANAGGELSADEVVASKLIADALQESGRPISEFLDTIALSATRKGRAMQAFSLYGKLTPAGAIKYANDIIRRVKVAAPNSKLAKTLKITKKAEDQISEQANIVQRVIKESGEESDEFREAVAKLMTLTQQEVPPSLARKVKTIDTISLLSSVKTLERNILGNLSVAGVEAASRLPSTLVDVGASFVTGQRTTGLGSPVAAARGFVSGAKKGARDVKFGIDTRGIGTDKLELTRIPTFGKLDIEKGGIVVRRPEQENAIKRAVLEPLRFTLKQAEQALGYSLTVPDRAFFESTVQSELVNLNKIAPEWVPSEEKVKLAVQKGLRVSLQDKNRSNVVMNGLRKVLDMVGLGPKGDKFGLGQAIIKFSNVPGSLLHRFIEFSPLGLLDTASHVLNIQRTITDPRLRKWLMQREITTGAGRVITGGGIIATGSTLGALGIIKGANKPRGKEKIAEDLEGQKDYTINLSALERYIFSGLDPDEAIKQDDDTIVKYDFFSPGAPLLAMGADLQAGADVKDKSFWLGMVDVTVNSATGIFEQPVLQGVNNFIKSAQYEGGIPGAIVDSIASIPSRFVPSLLRDVRLMTDNTFRDKYTDSVAETSLNLILDRIPGFSDKLAPRTSVFGEYETLYEDDAPIANKIFNSFFNPFYTDHITADRTTKIAIAIYRESGEGGVVPRDITSRITYPGGVEFKLDNYEEALVQQIFGSSLHDVYSARFNDPNFKDKTVAEQADILMKDEKDVYDMAKYHIYAIRLGAYSNPEAPIGFYEEAIKSLRGTKKDDQQYWDNLSQSEKTTALKRYISQ
jgi:enoyl-CoA hydratase/carnithine racemase